jgi:hypothetical protein
LPALDEKAAIDQIHAWNPRKQQVFKPEHIRTAWNHLRAQDWMPAAQGGQGADEAARQLASTRRQQ